MLRRALLAALLVLVGVAELPAPAHAAAPIVWTTDFPDPFILPVGPSEWLAYSTITGHQGLPVQHVPVLRSTDLSTWTYVADALPNGPASWAVSGDIWAPGVYDAGGGAWRLYYATTQRSSGTPCISVATGSSATGPFTDSSSAPIVCQFDLDGSIDPQPFRDADGTPYLLWRSYGKWGFESAVYVQQLTANGLGVTGPATKLIQRDQGWEVGSSPLIENPSMVLHNGRYFLFYSARDWFDASYATGYAVCATIRGPCGKVRNAPLIETHGDAAGPGGATAFVDPSGHISVGFAAWTPGKVGYSNGGQRSLRVRRVKRSGDDLWVEGTPSAYVPFGIPDALVRQQYRDVLGREGDGNGVSSWTWNLATGRTTPPALIESFIKSNEFGAVVAPVARLYSSFFGRAPDTGGLLYWVNQVRAGGTLSWVAQSFTNTAEFQACCGSQDDGAFVDTIYRHVLGRDPDAGGRAYWVGRLSSGSISRGDMVLAFSESSEHVQSTQAVIDVTMVYLALLRRTPEASGLDYWVGQIRQGRSLQGLIAGVFGSDEYRNRF